MPRWIKTLVSGYPNLMCSCCLGSDIILESALFYTSPVLAIPYNLIDELSDRRPIRHPRHLKN